MAIMIPTWVDGTLTPVEKLEAHRLGLRHKAVSVFVLNGDRILLQQRAMSKYHTPGLWANTCCTHPEWDEAPDKCALRRLNEELGITDVDIEFRQHLEYRADVGNGLIEHELVDVFVAQVGPTLDVLPNPEEVMDTRWANYADLRAEVQAQPKMFTPWLRIYLEDHSEAIFGRDVRESST